jgi:hypothetical protein
MISVTKRPAGMGFVTVFNIAGTGEVQLLYPSPDQSGSGLATDPSRRFTFNTGAACPPFGADHFIIIATKENPTDLRQALADLDQNVGAATAVELVEVAIANDKGVVRVAGVYTAPDPEGRTFPCG